MAHNNTISSHGGLNILGSAANLVSGVLRAFKQVFAFAYNTIKTEIVVQRTASELRQLSDRELSDIGISRYNIEDVARGVYKRD